MQRKPGPREEYRLQEIQRVKDSSSLAEKFPRLKSLKAELAFYNSAGVTRNSEIKYKANLDHAKSVFRFDCHNHECVGGDFDLSDLLAKAIAARRTKLSGEMRCQ
ncbi:MAG TPA: hypothetical protein VKA67_13760, partial [Verrucomicrobiae bacterium]|nr:hypothetical protein [Verrucomicrobiae bacterium]